MQDGARAPLSSTVQQTEGGRTGPYKAVAFGLIPCGDLPSLDAVGDVARASEILNAYLVRVGANGTCLSDPNFGGLCNAPLSAATEYRWVREAALPWPRLGKAQEGEVCEATCLVPGLLKGRVTRPGPLGSEGPLLGCLA